ncbi:MAG TPA: 4Fe-4S binding protein [Spirochaetota bacterium]|nr:4Fe-4S binding protein [Spirochaetota bacterium]
MNSPIISYVWVLLITYIVIGFFFPAAGLAAVLCMSAPVIIAFFKGRLWCGKFCPRGLFLNLLPGRRAFTLPAVMRSRYFRFGFFIALMGAFTIQLSFSGGSITEIGIVFHRMVVITTVAAVIGGLLFSKRTWCTVCPMGTLAHYVSPTAKMQKQKKTACGLCGGPSTEGCGTTVNDRIITDTAE